MVAKDTVLTHTTFFGEGLNGITSPKWQICLQQQKMMLFEEGLGQKRLAVWNSGQNSDKNTASTANSSQQKMMGFKQELRQKTLAVWSYGQRYSDQNTASKANSSPKGLAALYEPPLPLVYDGPFEKVKMEAALQEKWLLVNMQSIEEFNSHVLNRDTWKNETLSQIILSSFVFWQVCNTMSEGRMVCKFYNLGFLPTILLINPITGQKMREWTDIVQPDCLIEDLLPYLDKGPKDHQAV